MLNTICVFCGASHGNHAAYREAAVELGEEMARRKLGLVYGGGSVGLMGTVATAVAAQGAPVTGVIPNALKRRELSGETVGELIPVASMNERKLIMARLSDAFVAMPGGFGTMDELFEMVTWGQLGIQSKPIGLLNTNGYWDPLLAWVDHALAEGFIRAPHRDLMVVAESAAELLDRLATHQPPAGLTKWLDWEQL